MTKKDRKERMRLFWNMVHDDLSAENLAKLHIKEIRRELAVVEEHLQYNGKAHKYLPRIINMNHIEDAMKKVKDHIAYRTILGEYNGVKDK